MVDAARQRLLLRDGHRLVIALFWTLHAVHRSADLEGFGEGAADAPGAARDENGVAGNLQSVAPHR